ncbi:uncharacterized protein A4U43_C01F5630 [Asparagus officinalis]|uniref:SAM domain-containing protein n=1 Tax=Asparagus officinalis TaxID=4686 RepID=A0A5P1FM25_ASPOF|nr:protein bicaudal C homolog 1-B-like [Asparagus officinalis]XP_020274609.1 protein bicaudal C homolog 1-B-like [Asparagus officinalis]ONK79366.1 uncharacterized protein A4U43_C01F5630 [Asparagus officinalis]
MMDFGMNPKRQRRPNVRLGDIGDIFVSFSRKSFSKPKLDAQRWEVEPNKPRGCNNLVDTQNWENWNPNSKDYDLGLEETDMRNPRTGFGMVNRKRRLKKQRSGTNNSSRISPEITKRTEKAYVYGNPDYGILDHDTWDRDRDACEENSNYLRPKNSWKQENILPSDYDHCLSGKNPCSVRNVVHSVNEWLVELGFGEYADLFEMHEVDEEALPLLTYEDLKEMGIASMGTRRRLYSAIQFLSKGSGTT